MPRGALGRRPRPPRSRRLEQATAVAGHGPELAAGLLALRDALDPSGPVLVWLVRIMALTKLQMPSDWPPLPLPLVRRCWLLADGTLPAQAFLRGGWNRHRRVVFNGMTAIRR